MLAEGSGGAIGGAAAACRGYMLQLRGWPARVDHRCWHHTCCAINCPASGHRFPSAEAAGNYNKPS